MPARAEWFGPGQQVAVHGFQLRGGMVYVGQGLKAPVGRIEPGVIDPTLPIDNRLSARPEQDLGYSPAYHQISPASRAAYLAWHAGGRRDPVAPIGYVFLFFYGLERRVLVDIQADRALVAEMPAIRAELTELVAVYGRQNESFRGHAGSLIDLIDVLEALYQDRPLPSPALRDNRYDLPPTLRIELGRRAAAGQTIPGDLALAWAWYLLENTPRTPALRCRAEFDRLFTVRFAQQFPDGLAVRPGKARVPLPYFAANAGLRNVVIRLAEIPDVFELRSPAQKLLVLFDRVTNELDAYSRWLGRNPDGAGGLAAAARLPADLVQDSPALRPLREWADGRVGQRYAVRVPATELVRLWPSTAADRLAKPEAVALAQLLGHLGYGMEPDVRFGGPPLAASGEAVLFRLPPDSPHSPTPGYNAAAALVQLAAAVGVADGDASTAEIELLGDHLRSSLNLLPGEMARLHANLMWLATIEINLNGLQKRLDAIDEARRRTIGRVMVALASADGAIAPAEVTILTRIFRLLRLDPSLVPSQIHASLTGGQAPAATQPVIVRPGEAGEPGYRIPPRPVPDATTEAAAFALDLAAIQTKLAETAEVSALLGNLFAEEETPAPLPPAPVAVEGTTVGGLDGTHSLLLRAVAKRETWSRAEFEELAAEYHLMPDGAIDVLNEAGYETAGEPVLDGDETLTVSRYAIEELLR